MNREDFCLLAAIVAGLVAAVSAIVLPIALVSNNSTERMRMCVENGGAYLNVPEKTTMECQMPGVAK